MNIEFIITIITIIAGFLGIIKFLIDLTNRVTKLEVELTNRVTKLEVELKEGQTELKIEVIKLQNQFGIVETKQADLKTEINEVKTEVHELKTQTNERINQVETDNRTFIKELFQSLESWMKRPTAL